MQAKRFDLIQSTNFNTSIACYLKVNHAKIFSIIIVIVLLLSMYFLFSTEVPEKIIWNKGMTRNEISLNKLMLSPLHFIMHIGPMKTAISRKLIF